MAMNIALNTQRIAPTLSSKNNSFRPVINVSQEKSYISEHYRR